MENLISIGKNIYVNDYEIGVLKKCNIDVFSLETAEELLFLIDKYLDDVVDLLDEEIEEIDYVAKNISERKYYWDTNK